MQPFIDKYSKKVKKKLLRLDFIKQTVASHEIELQDELLQLLLANGFMATQATLSRDLKELKIAKMPNSEGRYYYRLHRNLDVKAPKYNDAHLEGGVSLVFSQNIAVLHTRPGYASVIAANIDACPELEVLGTIAGDDTVMIVLKEQLVREDFVRKLMQVIPDLVYSL